MSVVEMDEQSFSLGEGITVVDFWAPWCGPCRALAPSLEKMASKYQDSIAVRKVNVQENKELAVQFGIRSIPCIVVFEGGKEVDRLVGFGGESHLEELFIKHG
jgi:thioredoxin 1